MILQIENVVDAEAIAAMRAALAKESQDFKPGAATAGWHARSVKNNEQSSGPAARDAIARVEAALMGNAVFKAAARPKKLTGMLVSRYGAGMSYGLHVDDALMGGTRTDLSFTVFLAEPESYDGGELLIEGNDGTSAIRLPAGSAVVYPTTSLHRVAEVSRGERLVVVGWVRSYIRQGDRREILFDLDQSVAQLRESGVERAVLDRILKTRANLMRMWAED
jgi:PKHD-type hydroxylase